MKAVTYTRGALKDFRKHGTIAARVRKVIADYAADPRAHANNVTQLVGLTEKRMRVGDFRVLFNETDGEILVVKIAPRGEAYD